MLVGSVRVSCRQVDALQNDTELPDESLHEFLPSWNHDQTEREQFSRPWHKRKRFLLVKSMSTLFGGMFQLDSIDVNI